MSFVITYDIWEVGNMSYGSWKKTKKWKTVGAKTHLSIEAKICAKCATHLAYLT